MSASNEQPHCPVCREHTAQDSLSSQGVVLTAVEALLKADDQAIKDAYSVFTQYDAHVAVTLLAGAYDDLCRMANLPLQVYLLVLRKRLNEIQAQSS